MLSGLELDVREVARGADNLEESSRDVIERHDGVDEAVGIRALAGFAICLADDVCRSAFDVLGAAGVANGDGDRDRAVLPEVARNGN